MYFAIKTVSWIERSDGAVKPATGVCVEEVFTTEDSAMLYIGNTIDSFKKADSGRYEVSGSYPLVMVHDLEIDEWISYYVQKKGVVL